MKDILANIETWQQRGDQVAVATVVNTWGSSPRTAGAKMAVNHKGEMVGSVSGGCVEGAVVQEALRVLKTGRPKLLQYGVADETAWDVDPPQARPTSQAVSSAWPAAGRLKFL